MGAALEQGPQGTGTKGCHGTWPVSAPIGVLSCSVCAHDMARVSKRHCVRILASVYVSCSRAQACEAEPHSLPQRRRKQDESANVVFATVCMLPPPPQTARAAGVFPPPIPFPCPRRQLSLITAPAGLLIVPPRPTPRYGSKPQCDLILTCCRRSSREDAGVRQTAAPARAA